MIRALFRHLLERRFGHEMMACDHNKGKVQKALLDKGLQATFRTECTLGLFVQREVSQLDSAKTE